MSEVPVYGRAYPEQSAYAGTGVPVQTVVPLQYSIKAGQQYVLADDSIDTDVLLRDDLRRVLPDRPHRGHGQDKYDEIWFGHRMFYVRKADVSVG